MGRINSPVDKGHSPRTDQDIGLTPLGSLNDAFARSDGRSKGGGDAVGDRALRFLDCCDDLVCLSCHLHVAIFGKYLGNPFRVGFRDVAYQAFCRRNLHSTTAAN